MQSDGKQAFCKRLTLSETGLEKLKLLFYVFTEPKALHSSLHGHQILSNSLQPGLTRPDWISSKEKKLLSPRGLELN